MSVNETRNSIKEEYIDAYYEWLFDQIEMPEYELIRKYGYGKPKHEITDSIKALEIFQKYVGFWRTYNEWKKSGYDMKDILTLQDEKFLSTKYDYRNRKEYLYIRNDVAKSIYRELKRNR